MPEHEGLEADIEALARDVGAALEKPEGRERGHKEVLREALREKIYPAAAPPSAAPNERPAPGTPQRGSGFLPDYAASLAPAVRLKIERLLDFAWHQGIEKAAREAEKEGSFFLDAFHDALTEKLYDEFVKRGLIK